MRLCAAGGSWHLTLVIAAAGSTAVAGAACRTVFPTPDAVVIITLDTTRADSVSALGGRAAWTPHIDRLAASGVVFEEAMTVSPLTLPAHCSLFTGLLPFRHGVRDNADAPLSAAHETLAEVLRRGGFETAAFVGSAVLGADRGLSAGFDLYDDEHARRPTAGGLQRRANETVDAVIAWLEGRGTRRFFLWLHLYDPHAPYDPPEPFRSAYADEPYAGEIAFVDAQIGRIADVLERRGLLDRTALIVAGDHGESLNEHGEAGHGIFVYQSVMHVPLVIRAPGVRPRRIAEVTRLVDVMPTVLDLAGVDGPAASLDGISLVRAMRGAATLDLEAYSESHYPARFGWSPLRSLRDRRFKLIAAPRPELYDLQTDPTELHNLVTARPELARAMARRLREWQPPLSETAPNGTAPPSVQVRERLAALGYVTRGPIAPALGQDPLADPKDHIDEYNALARRRSEIRRRR